MEVQLPPDTEAILRQHATVAGLSIEDCAVRKLNEVADVSTPETSRVRNHKAWMEEIRAWSAGHPSSNHFVDDSRESIYEGRGL